MIEAVVFDFGNVLYRFDRRLFISRLGELTGKDGEILYRKVYESDLPIKFESGEIGGREFHREVLKKAGVDVTYEEFVTAFCSMFSPVEGMASLVRALKGVYRLGLLSNTNEIHFTHFIATRDIFPLFDAVTLSYEVGVMKPAREIYEDVIAKLGVASGRCVFIDDVEKNVEGARAAGMEGIHFRGRESLLNDLRRVGVGV